MKIDHLNNLRALEAVLRKGGLRPAATELGVTPAAVGQQIRTLEAHLGRGLLTRQPTGAVPTAEAQQVAADLSRHMAGLGDVLTHLRSQRPANRISVSVLPSFAESWFPRHLSTLFADIPELDLRLDASRHVADLFDGSCDFAIRHLDRPSAEYEGRLLLEDDCAPICTPDFAQRYGLTPDSRSLEHVPMAEIAADAPGASTKLAGLADWCASFSIAPPGPKSGQVLLDHATGYRMAGSGLVIFLAGVLDMLDDLSAGRIVLPFGPGRSLRNDFSFWLIWRRDLRLSAPQKRFVSWITDTAAQDRARIARLLTAPPRPPGTRPPAA